MSLKTTFGAVCAVLCLCLPAYAAESDLRVVQAAMGGDRDGVRALLEKKAEVNTPQGDGTTALHWAALNNDPQMVQLLVAAGANLNAATRVGGLTPIAMGCTKGYAPVIKALLDAGASANTSVEGGLATCLMLAASSGNAQSVELLLDHGADVNAKESRHGQTALMFAATKNRADVIKVLMKHGADSAVASTVVRLARRRTDADGNPLAETGAPKAPGSDEEARLAALMAARDARATVLGGMTALLFAARDGGLEAAAALVEGGADVNLPHAGDKTTPLIMAINNAHFELGKFLLEHGADPNTTNDDGLAPLYATIDTEYASVSWTPPAITMQEKVTHLELLKALLDRGAKPNVRLARKLWYRPTDHDQAWTGTVGTTPFWRAAASNDLAAMKMLVAYGADPLIPSNEDVTPMMAASGIGWSAGTTKNVPGSWLPVIEYCLEFGGDVNDSDVFGYTPLHGASYRGDNEVVKFLVAKGAKVNIKSNTEMTLTDMANGPQMNSKNGLEHLDTIELLMSMGAPEPRPEPIPSNSPRLRANRRPER
jgi:ankyrin repeat protein